MSENRRPSGLPDIPESLRERAPSDDPKKRRRWSLLPDSTSTDMKAIGIGLDFAAMVGASALFGWIMWQWLGSRAWLWAWLALGMACSAWKFYKDARSLNRELTRQERNRR